jgi:indole-3-glycerol phosphate synthase
MPTLLEAICERKREHIAAVRRIIPEALLRDTISLAPPVRPFRLALQQRSAANIPALITEIKRASPSVGIVRDPYDPIALAKAYEAGGAACLSVLTDAPYFQGHLDDMVRARAACSLPVLRKDFMLEPYQVWEARANGADCILLIMACLPVETAQILCDLARRLGMDVLVEVHTEAEREVALRLPTRLLGINNRDLKTLKTDISISRRLSKDIPADYTLVSESGLETAAEIRSLQPFGVSAFLVGHSLLKQRDLQQATKSLLSQ